MRLIKFLIIFGATYVNSNAINPRGQPIWLTLPPTPSLPQPISTPQPINGVKLWSQWYNKQQGKIPIVMVHGGLGYSAYFGDVLTKLVANQHSVILVDRRGHGRSTFNNKDEFTFEMFVEDIYAQLEILGVKKHYLVGWSDGAITAMTALLNPALACNIQKTFLFAGSMVPEDTNSTFSSTKIYSDFVSRCATEYATNQPTADFKTFAMKVAKLEARYPQFTTADLRKINGSKVAIVGAQYDEAVNREVPAKLNKAIVGSTLIMLDCVSHFAPLQDPTRFTQAIERFFGSNSLQ
ncbi:hypothetical protein CROQUDRAFT_60546 [Cronartium quercuum f. sp. fusiforme G11]|uniref:AB hydrolase-1 domain-containing protein n=1 Tax=Cronartium quercuum f. sp. fusiforme G11 TaxID=708437 RepID=A0A9P6TF42_9BASI|nr:hypothetical protein CROQUDRAFT_60546 [Cronartium quercuum f. sp. fusiforme G11]